MTPGCANKLPKRCRYCTRRPTYVCPKCGAPICGQCQRSGECRVHAARGE